jgi:O-succinylbenzoate synthase
MGTTAHPRTAGSLRAVRIEAIELWLLDLPMRRPFTASHGTVVDRRVVVVRVHADGGLVGWGECAALPSPTYTSEFADGAFVVLRDHLLPRVLGAPGVSAASVHEAMADVVGHGMAKAAIELALLDAEGRRDGRRLVEVLTGTARGAVPVGAALGLDEPAALAATAEALVAEGYRRLKVKVTPGHDVEALRAVRAAVGAGVALVADANGAYRLGGGGVDDARRLVALDELGLAALEQPLPADDLDGHATLVRRLATPIALDESLSSPAALERALALGALDLAVVKAPVLGGWRAAADALERCRAAGIGASVGGMLDAAVGRAATTALAAHPAVTLTGDQSPGRRTFHDDLAPDLTWRGPEGAAGAELEVPSGPGVGVEPDPGALGRLAVERAERRR